MTQQNTILKKYNGTSYDNVYPTTKASDVKCTNPFTGEASNLQDTIDYMKEAANPHFILFDGDREETYVTDRNMTWGQWVTSAYNTTNQSQITDNHKIGVLSDGTIGYKNIPEMGAPTIIYIYYMAGRINVQSTDTVELGHTYYVQRIS